jgi:hypothetical protein
MLTAIKKLFSGLPHSPAGKVTLSDMLQNGWVDLWCSQAVGPRGK